MFGGGGGSQGGCEQRIEVLMKIQKKKNFLGRGAGSGWGGQGGCERRIEVFVKIQKKNWGGGLGWNIRTFVDILNNKFHSLQ